MSRPLPKNLQRLYAMVGKEAADRMMAGVEFTVDGIEFVSGYRPESTAERFFIAKPPDLVALFREFVDERDPARIFELGIAEGGSTALLALREGLEQLVAIDNEQHRLPALDEFIEARGLGDKVHPHFGVDQADRGALRALVDEHFGEAPIDLVIDDASHVYDLTLASFNCLFPHVAVGGWYVIEDWAQDLKMAETIHRTHLEAGTEPDYPEPTPNDRRRMDRFVVEFTMAMGAWPGAIQKVAVTDHHVAAQRGPAALDPDEFRLDSITGAAQLLGIIARSADPRP